MKFDKNHPKLTAYALDELNKKESKLVIQLIEAKPELKEHVADIQNLARNLAAEMEKEQTPSLTSKQKAYLLAKLEEEYARGKRFMKIGFALVPVFVALLAVAIYTKQIEKQSTGGTKSNFTVSKNEQPSSDYDLVETQKQPAEKTQGMNNKSNGVNLSTLGLGTGKILSKTGPGAIHTYFKFSAGGAGGGMGGVGTGATLGLAGSGAAINNFGSGTGGFGSGEGGTGGLGGVGRGRPGFKTHGIGGIGGSSLGLFMGSGFGNRYHPQDNYNTESYHQIIENQFIPVDNDPLSTFSIDVDTASYANLRRFLTQGQMPPRDSVRIEEMINYFEYSYPQPSGDEPFSINTEVASSPWASQHKLVKIGLKGKDFAWKKRPAANLVFLLDVSGSMDEPNKLPLLKTSFKKLVEKLTEHDSVAIVTYSGNSGVALYPTSGDQKSKILNAIDSLISGGSTNGAAGIEQAYNLAMQNLKPKSVNRVILATDGDFNVGMTNETDLLEIIKEKALKGVHLTVLGFGMGNYKDSTLETLADKGNGNYSYIDTEKEATKVFSEQITGTLITIAKDVKIQVEFNPSTVNAYRLIGYENRVMAHQDFNNDKKDAGDIGAGHTVTALYEIVPKGVQIDSSSVDALKYQGPSQNSKVTSFGDELLTVKLRYKTPASDESKLLTHVVKNSNTAFALASSDFRFASVVAAFGMHLMGSKFKGSIDINQIESIAKESLGSDGKGYKKEFIDLVRKSKTIKTTSVNLKGN